jgi:hypothetical protein
MSDSGCATALCRFSEWWRLLPRLKRDGIIALCCVTVVLAGVSLTHAIGGAEPWIWHIPG